MAKHALAIVLAVLTQTVYAEDKLIEVDRLGPTRSIQYYYVGKAQPKQVKPAAMPELTIEQWYEKMLPITTETLSVGPVNSEPRDNPMLHQPVFLLGSDKVSQDWLKENRESLIDAEALGILVEVSSIAELRLMATLGKGLQIAPTNGTIFAELLGVSHYPVLITKQGIEQ